MVTLMNSKEHGVICGPELYMYVYVLDMFDMKICQNCTYVFKVSF